MSLLQVFYVSQAAMPYEAGAIQDILLTSRRNNARDDLTGCLLFSGCYFGQILEGGADRVMHRLQRIRADARHAGVRLIVEKRAPERDYADWSMGYLHDLSLEDALERLVKDETLDPEVSVSIMERMRPDIVMGALR